MQTGCILYLSPLCVVLLLSSLSLVLVTLCIAFQGTIWFPRQGKSPVAAKKISGENDGSSWRLFSVSQVIGYENVRWVSTVRGHTMLPLICVDTQCYP